ncbi:hypothetical protein Tco_0960842 [Tanacetum coccineum]
MLPEWSRFITEVKLNKGLKESNFDKLYAYLKQHEVHANENRTMMERFLQPTNDPLALEVDINKKAENRAKMTKLSMEWKRLCKIKAKVQKCQSQSQYRRISSQTGAGTEEYYWMQS